MNCPISKCKRTIPSHLIMCRRHWHLLPTSVRDAVYDAWWKRQRAQIDLRNGDISEERWRELSDQHRDVKQQAIDYVEAQTAA
jgi:hypothetical protein